MLPDLPNEYVKRATERTNSRYATAWINVRPINCEHVWYIAKMEGMVSVIVTAVDIASRNAFKLCNVCITPCKVAYDNV